MRIVIVEDEISIRSGIKKMLERFGTSYEVAGEAENGEEGLQVIREKRPDLVITDIKMNRMDGLEMLKQMRAEGIAAQAIVLSAYSEFEYARGAMKMGVTEYLLKPIGITEFLQALENVEEKLKKERSRKPEQIGTLEQTARDFLEGNGKMDREVSEYLLTSYGIRPDSEFLIVCAYLGEDYEADRQTEERRLRQIFSLWECSVCILGFPEKKSVIALAYHYQSARELERYLQRQMLEDDSKKAVYGCTEVSSLTELEHGLKEMYPFMDWNISFDEEVLIAYPQITRVQVTPCVYPIEIETACKAALCTGAWEKLRSGVKAFQNSFRGGTLYDPREIKECYTRFLWMIMEMAKEIDALKQEHTEQQVLLRMIANAKRRSELNEAADQVLDMLVTKQEDGVTHLTVKRTLNMIREFYGSGITLEQISEKLNVTPEYLGTQFHKETGRTFSAYLRDYRISKAKELLCGTDLKQYEIAEQVGYSDPKYFCKVFKKAVGMLPAEYRKACK